jgi:hypothetical protein
MFSTSKTLYFCYSNTNLNNENGEPIRIEGDIKSSGVDAYNSFLEKVQGYNYETNDIIIVKLEVVSSKFLFQV